MKAPWVALGPRRPRCIDRGVAGRDPSNALLFFLFLPSSFSLSLSFTLSFSPSLLLSFSPSLRLSVSLSLSRSLARSLARSLSLSSALLPPPPVLNYVGSTSIVIEMPLPPHILIFPLGVFPQLLLPDRLIPYNKKEKKK